MEIKNVTIIGANGTLGKLISAIFASFGEANVYMVARDKTSINVQEVAKTVKAMSIKDRLIPKRL